MLIAVGLVWISGGLVWATNVQGHSRHFHFAMHSRWVMLDDGVIRRSVRMCFIPGALPFWAFRTICFLVMVCGGAALLIWQLD